MVKAAVASLLMTVALFTKADVTGACSNFIKDYYAEIGCRVESADESGCPLSYDCSSQNQRSKERCHYNGSEFEIQERLEASPSTACLADCHCRRGETETNRAVFLCADVECPELFRGPPRPGCYYAYEHDQCCMVKEVCGPDAVTRNQDRICEYKGESYLVGQQFYSKEEPCMTCICQKDFKGVLEEPYCRKISCNLELVSGSQIAEGCIPIYYGENGCCPIDWRCPAAETDRVLPSNTKSSDSGKTCKFGKLTLQIGERLSRGTETGEVDCACTVPPHPVCVQKAD